MPEHEVLIVGGGPTGLMLAGELRLAGADVAIVDRRPTSELAGSRAGGFHSRTIEILDQRGIAGRFLVEGQVAQTARFGDTTLDISDFPTRHPYGLGLWQNKIERILGGWVRELAVPIQYGIEVTGFAQDDSGVDVELSDGRSLRARYLVGCDGGRSLVRKVAGIEFPGWDATTSSLIAQVEMAQEPELGIRRDAHGTYALGKVEYEIVDGKVVYQKGGTVSWGDRVRSIDATYGGAWELPVIGAISAPSAVLIRPDGYVAWVGEQTDEKLTEALGTWFGAAGDILYPWSRK